MDDDTLTKEHAARLRRLRREVLIRFAAVLLLNALLVVNDAMLVRALFVALLVPPQRGFQCRLNNCVVR